MTNKSLVDATVESVYFLLLVVLLGAKFLSL